MENSWLMELKPRDAVLVSHLCNTSVERVGKVWRVTKTMIVLDDAMKFSRATGRRTGSYGLRVRRLLRPTPTALAEARREVLRRDMVRRLETERWERLDFDTVRRVYEALNPSVVEQNPEASDGRCKDCRWRGKTGCCENNDKLHEEGFGERSDQNDHLVYSYNEDGDFWVGPDFGCVHWADAKKEALP